MKKQDLVRELRSARASLDILLAEIGEDRMEAPGADGEYSVKDLIAHLTAYEAWTADWLAAARQGEVLPPGLFAEADSEKRDAVIYSLNRDRELVDVLEGFWQDFERLVAEIEVLRDIDLEDAERSAWFIKPFFPDGRTLGECILDHTCNHYNLHLTELERWRSRR